MPLPSPLLGSIGTVAGGVGSPAFPGRRVTGSWEHRGAPVPLTLTGSPGSPCGCSLRPVYLERWPLGSFLGGSHRPEWGGGAPRVFNLGLSPSPAADPLSLHRPHIKTIFQGIAAKVGTGEPCCDWASAGPSTPPGLGAGVPAAGFTGEPGPEPLAQLMPEGMSAARDLVSDRPFIT